MQGSTATTSDKEKKKKNIKSIQESYLKRILR